MTAVLYNPFRVGSAVAFTQGSRQRQPWAEMSNPFGVKAVRTAFRRNQVVSSLAGDFDHKSCWELFTDDRFGHFFTPAQWRIFNRHILWTRLIRETKTTQESGRTVD